MATVKQRRTFKELMKAIQNPDDERDLNEILQDGGYAESTARNPKNLGIDSDGFQQLLAMVDDRVLLSRLYEFVMDSDDKRVALDSIKTILDLKGHKDMKITHEHVYKEFMEEITEEVDSPNKVKVEDKVEDKVEYKE